jgi:aquaglyceroporin related protein
MSGLQPVETKRDTDIYNRMRSGTNSTGAPTDKTFTDDQPPTIDDTYRSDLWWSRVRSRHQDFFSEFFGVFILILFGCGSIAQAILSNNANGPYQNINWGE